MERLTNKVLTKARNDPWDYCGLDSFCTRDCFKPTPCELPKVIDRLAEIENILGDDYDLDRLRELVEADRDGRAVILPVKVGGMVYRVITTRDCPPLLSEIEIKTVEQAASLIGRMGKHLVISYYYTLEEANAALKGERDGVH